MNKEKRRIFLLLFFLILFLLTGCNAGKIDENKVRDLDYTVTSEDRLPKELSELLEEKKESPFKMTYRDGEYLYLCRGYGTKPCGGYSIQVSKLYQTSNAICFFTSLIGPSDTDKKENVKTTPYIVVKTEYQDMTVVFE